MLAAMSLLTACGGDPTAPAGPGDASSPPDVLLPSFASEPAYPGTMYICRQFNTGFAQILMGGSWWGDACPIQGTETPSPYMGSVNPGPVTITMSAPITHIIGRMMYACPPVCPITQMGFAVWRPNEIQPFYDGPLFNGTENGQTFNGWDVEDFESVIKLKFTPPDPLPPDNAGFNYRFYFEFDFAVPCPPIDDPVFDGSPAVRQALNREYEQSIIDGKERVKS